ncbi:MAG: DegT/DnrJ/EryC1/StrS family aminotransferase [bacterium]
MKTEQLAVNGGDPVTESSIDFHRPDLGEQELANVNATFESGWVAGPGANCEAVEENCESRWSVTRVLTMSSCTHALETALMRLDLDENDEVIVPSYTYVSTALAVVRAGATPVFADVSETSLTLSRDTVEDVSTHRTQAVIFVHYGGFPGPVQPIADLCEQNNWDLIEDAAQAFDSRRDNRPAGTVGRFGAISFHGTKSLTCGEGGLLLVNDESDVKPCEMIRDKGTDRSRYLRGEVDKYTWRSRGSSYVLSDIQGAVLRAQIDRWEDIRKARRRVQKELRNAVRSLATDGDWELIEPPKSVSIRENGHLTAFLVNPPNRAQPVLEALRAEGIEAKNHYQPLHQSPFARKELDAVETLPVSERLASQLIRLPTHSRLSETDLEDLKKGLRKVYGGLMH